MPVSDVPAPMLPPPQQAEPVPVPPRVSLRGQLDQCMAALQNSEFRIAVLEAAATTQHQRLLQCETELQLYRGSSPIEMRREVQHSATSRRVTIVQHTIAAWLRPSYYDRLRDPPQPR